MDGSNLASLQTIEKLYQDYQKNPASVPNDWQSFFKGVDFADLELTRDAGGKERIYLLIDAYRRFGHLFTAINPLRASEKELPEQLKLENLFFDSLDLSQTFPPCGFFDSDVTLSQMMDKLSDIYCSRIGFEYMHIENMEQVHWIQEQIEPKLQIDASVEDKKFIMEYLNKAELFDSFLNVKYVGQTRFSIEGAETFIPLLAFLLEKGADDLEVDECLIGIAHRGRLNLLANIFRKSYALIFHEFEAHYMPLTMEGTSDVKYHKGYSSDFETRKGKKVHLHLAANASHLESVDPVVLGQTYAKQILKKDEEKKRIIPLLIHGDAAISAQGVVYESLGMMHIDGYSVGGTIHVVINNQIGYTTLPEEGRSFRYPTDIAKIFNCPVFHVNAEDPEGCIYAAKLAMEIRARFHTDVFIDLICYRKYGHNEGDDPSFTQPLLYQTIRSKKSPREIYRDTLYSQGVLEKEIAEKYEEEFKNELHKHFEEVSKFKDEPPKPEEIYGKAWEEFLVDEKILDEIETKCDAKKIALIAEKSSELPEGFHLHQKLHKWLEDRKSKVNQEPKKLIIDWALAEHLAFGALLMDQIPVRLSGQDCRRGTFNHRHEVYVDQENGKKYFPLQHLSDNQANFTVYNSILSEFAVMGFEYGYSLSNPKSLTLWEAQYGDFVNGAQIILDQYLTTSEMKWNRRSGLVLLLPHGYEGAGPEHSSARMERFLQLSGHDNIQVVYPSTPAQYFHLLRKQGLRKLRKPLIVFTPKSLLRLPYCASSLQDFTEGSFQEVLDDPTKPKAKKILLCTGKIYYDLILEREKRSISNIAIIRIEELYPIHTEKLKKIVESYQDISEISWVQEEPENMGAWFHLMPVFSSLFGKVPCYIGRERSASTASGSHRIFKEQQQKIIDEALGGNS